MYTGALVMRRMMLDVERINDRALSYAVISSDTSAKAKDLCAISLNCGGFKANAILSDFLMTSPSSRAHDNFCQVEGHSPAYCNSWGCNCNFIG